MQQWGIWLKDGQAIDHLGRVFGPVPRTLIASFWLRGVAAAFTSWKKLVALYLDAQDTYERTGSEEALKKFYNNDLAEPYYPKSMMDMRLPEALKARAESLGERKVPEGVRFLIATIDVQKNMFIVQVFGILPGDRFDTVVVDRYDVRNSQRTDDDGNALWVKPHAELDDWKELIPHVIEKEYLLDDDSGRVMQIKYVTCDSGGREGVTTMAYNFYRYLVSENKHRRFILVKGAPSPNQPRARISYPDSNRRDNKAGARGDVPVLLLNSNVLKDDLNGRLDCLEPGKGMYRTPDWLSDSFYGELCAEIRTPKGWENPAQARNESWDLSYYCIGICVSELVRVEHLDWSNPPGWAAEWDRNDLVRQADAAPRFAMQPEASYDFAEFAKALA
jgi:phage terminase large subunit GpA-like protein